MKKITLSLIAFVFLIGCSDPQVVTEVKTEQASEPKKEMTDLERGEYLVTTMGCDDCHSPKKFGPQGPYPDPDLRFSGHPANEQLPPYDNKTAAGWVLFSHNNTAAVGPWGTSFAANITSDSLSGIGNWTEAQFVKAMREGKSKGLDASRGLLPPMPWPAYSKLNDADMHAIFVFLKNTKPVSNNVPAPLPPAGAAH